MSHTNLLYHIVFATKERAPLIADALRPRLHEYLGGTVRNLSGIASEIGGVADHHPRLREVLLSCPARRLPA